MGSRRKHRLLSSSRSSQSCHLDLLLASQPPKDIPLLRLRRPLHHRWLNDRSLLCPLLPMSACSESLEPFTRGALRERQGPLSLEHDPQCDHRLLGDPGPDTDVADSASGHEAEMGHRIIVRNWVPVRLAITRNTHRILRPFPIPDTISQALPPIACPIY